MTTSASDFSASSFCNWIGAPASLVSQAGVVTAGRVVDGVRFVSVFGSWRVPAAGPAAALV